MSEKSLGEQKISLLLTENNIPFESQKTFDSCRFFDTGYCGIFDFYVDNRYLIEFDGEQHFIPVEYFGGQDGFNRRKEHDLYKNQWCFDNNVPLIRIPYTHLNDLCIQDLLLKTSQFIVKE